MASPKRKRRTVGEHGPHPIDVHVGQRVRQRRVWNGLSQTELANRIDLTFQQLQKYEHGMNRISASKLWELSQILNAPVQWFFMEYTEGKPQTESFYLKRETFELVRNFSMAPPEIQQRFLSFVKSIASASKK